ncbi:myo-inosose-2 dehydratase [uncultured Devosia sp.]|uniref:myo-inosose-2 dehydratase n=1 Tax=uncultured Devosia sp. TaxID=211434 RepID=UPI002625A305|nr:myo-inosose-2 dehydratase [uncultured Devosia sp.]
MAIEQLPDGVQLGVSPLSWTNEVLDDLGGETPLETCLSHARANGYEGVELGRKFPRDPCLLRNTLASHKLELVTGWYSGFLAERDVSAEMVAVEPHAKLLRDVGAKIIVYGPVGKMAPGAPLDLPMNERLVLDGGAVDSYGARLAEFTQRLEGEYGLTLAYHHHLMMVAETFDEISSIIDRARCGLLLDTGHAHAAGFEYTRLIERFGDLIRHIHLKDVRSERMEQVRDQNLSFNTAVRMGMFTVPGDGDIDFAPLATYVKTSGYQGWMVVEAEQDPSLAEAEPEAATRRAFDHVTTLFGKSA